MCDPHETIACLHDMIHDIYTGKDAADILVKHFGEQDVLSMAIGTIYKQIQQILQKDREIARLKDELVSKDEKINDLFARNVWRYMLP